MFVVASVEVAGRLASVEVAVRRWRFGAKKRLSVVVGVLYQNCGGKRVDWQRSADRGKKMVGRMWPSSPNCCREL